VLRIYDGDELIFDGDDPSTYVICSTADDNARLLGAPDPANAKEDR
jgi:hypothetical protein